MKVPYQQVEEDSTERRIRRNVKLVVAIAIVTFLVGISVAVVELFANNNSGTNSQRAPVTTTPPPAATTEDEPPTNPQDGEDDIPGPQDNDEAVVEDLQAETSRVEAPPSLRDSGSGFGSAIATTSSRVVVGASDARVNGVRTGAVLVYEKESTFGPWNFTQQLLLDSTTGASSSSNSQHRGLKFGSAVALSDQTIVVGAPGGKENGIENSGSAYIFGLQPDGIWHFIQQLTATDAARNHAFGTVVALEEDVMLVGAPGANHVYLFEQNRTTELWSLRDIIKPRESGSTDRFGRSMALKNGLLVVGAPGNEASDENSQASSGKVFVYRRRPNNDFAPKAKLTATDDVKANTFGASVATDGATVVIGAPSLNAAYVFEESTTANTWIEATKLEIPIQSINHFGTAVAVEQELIAVAASFNGTSQSSSGIAYAFVKGCVTGNRTQWGLRNQLLANNESPSDESFGSVVQILNGVVAVGSSNAEAVFFFNIPIALGPTCAPMEEPSMTPRTSPAPTNPSLRPTARATATDMNSNIGSQAPAPNSDSEVQTSCQECHALGIVPGYKMYHADWLGSVCADVCVPSSFLESAERFGWSCITCN